MINISKTVGVGQKNYIVIVLLLVFDRSLRDTIQYKAITAICGIVQYLFGILAIFLIYLHVNFNVCVQPLNIIQMNSYFICRVFGRIQTILAGGSITFRTFENKDHPTDYICQIPNSLSE